MARTFLWLGWVMCIHRELLSCYMDHLAENPSTLIFIDFLTYLLIYLPTYWSCFPLFPLALARLCFWTQAAHTHCYTTVLWAQNVPHPSRNPACSLDSSINLTYSSCKITYVFRTSILYDDMRDFLGPGRRRPTQPTSGEETSNSNCRTWDLKVTSWRGGWRSLASTMCHLFCTCNRSIPDLLCKDFRVPQPPNPFKASSTVLS